MNKYKFTNEHQKGIHNMLKFILGDYKNQKVDFRKSTLLDWLKFLMKMKDRKTYSDSNKSKLNDIRDYILRAKLFRYELYYNN